MAEDVNLGMEKTEPPTPRKLERSRSEGVVFSSQELVFTASLLLIGFFLFFYVPLWIKGIATLMSWSLSGFTQNTINPAWVSELSVFLGGKMLMWLLPLFGVVLFLTFALRFIQTGVVFSFKPFERGAQSMNVSTNWSSLWKQERLVNFIFQAAKYLSLLSVLVLFVRNFFTTFWNSPEASFSDLNQTLFHSVLTLLVQVVIVLIIFSALDFFYGKYRYLASLRMSRQEIQEEMKEIESDKTVRRAAMDTWKKLAEAQQVFSVKQAELLIVDDNERAVALKKHGIDQSWIVVAKLNRAELVQVRAHFEKKGLNVIEDTQLADLLFKKSKIKELLPLDLKIQVAEWVARLHFGKNKS